MTITDPVEKRKRSFPGLRLAASHREYDPKATKRENENATERESKQEQKHTHTPPPTPPRHPLYNYMYIYLYLLTEQFADGFRQGRGRVLVPGVFRFSGGSTAPLPVFLSIYPCAARCSLAGRNATLPRGPVGLYRAATPIMPNGHMRSCAGRGAKAVESGLRP